MKTQGKQLKVRWSAEEWTPSINVVVGALRDESLEAVRTLSLELPMPKRRVRKLRPILWARGGLRTNGLPGNNSRTSWR